MAKSPAWQRKEGKAPSGGLNAKGRASYNRETGGNLKAPQPEGGSRRDSFSYSGLFDFRDKHNHSKILTRSFGTGAIVKAGSLSATNGELAIKFTSSVKIIGIRLLGSKSIPARTPFSEIDWTNHFVQSVSFENGSWVEPKLILKGG